MNPIYPVVNPSPINSSESDSEETIDGDAFEWSPIESAEEDDENKEPNLDRFFFKWIEDKNSISKKQMPMNCAEGVIYYISEHEKGDDCLIGNIKNSMKLEPNQEKAKSITMNNLGKFLKLNGDKSQKGPFDIDLLENFDYLATNNIVKPGSILSFGSNSDDMHVAIVTKNKKIRSLWKNPDDENKSSFGKYSPQKLLKQIEAAFSSMTKEELKEEKLSTVFYVSNYFCHLFEKE